MNTSNSNSRANRSGNNRDTSQIQRIIVDINNVETIVNEIQKQLISAKSTELAMQNRIEFLEGIILTLTGIRN